MIPTPIIVVCVAVIFSAVVISDVLRRARARGKGAEQLPYQKRDFLLTAAERSFFGVLQQAVGEQHLIFVKVNLSDLLKIAPRSDNQVGHWNKINTKHADFVLCGKQTVSPLLVIELDDSSHRRRRRQQRDKFVDAACQAAGLPLVRFPAKRAYELPAVTEAIRRAMSSPEEVGHATMD